MAQHTKEEMLSGLKHYDNTDIQIKKGMAIAHPDIWTHSHLYTPEHDNPLFVLQIKCNIDKFQYALDR